MKILSTLFLWLVGISIGLLPQLLQAQDTPNEGVIFQNPNSGFEQYGAESENQPPAQQTPATLQAPTAEPDETDSRPTKPNKPKTTSAKGGKLPTTLNVDLDILYSVQIADTVVVRDRKPLPVSFKTKEDNKYFYNQAMLKVGAKDFQSALVFLNKCIKTEPYNKELLQLRANALVETADFKKAIKDYKRVLEITDSDPVIYYNLASTYLKMGKFGESVAAFDRAIILKPDYIFALQGRATSKTYQKDYEGAIEDYNRVLDINNQFLAAFKGRGIAKSLLHRYDEAVNDFTHIIELQPLDGMSYYYRGLAYVAQNQNYRGCSDFDRAYQLNVPQAAQEIKDSCR